MTPDRVTPALQTWTVQPSNGLRGTIRVPGDKSLSHRAVILNALASGTGRITGWLPAGDTLATLHAVRALGIRIDQPSPETLIVHGGTLIRPDSPLDLRNAGTGFRLLAGVLAGQSFASTLDGSEQLRCRPMRRITDPLRRMGAQVQDSNGFPPLHFKPATLHGITYEMPVASAQVKSALLLAGLFADEPTTVIEPGPARDHTERMLRAMGADLWMDGPRVTLAPGRSLHPLSLTIPGDFSSAAFLLVAATICPGSEVAIQHVNLNPTRTGLLDILQAMGATIRVTDEDEAGGEPVGTLWARNADLQGGSINGDLVVRMIDEFPILMVAALNAEGTTTVKDARELRVKETDRIAVMTGELRKMGAIIEERPDGFVIQGPQQLRGAVVDAHDDHRIAMSLAIAGLRATGETVVQGADCAADSFPGFDALLRQLGARIA